MKTTHTPGPWKVYHQDKNDRPGIDSENLSVIVYGNKNNEYDLEGVHGGTTEEEMANAKLIAAAPELFEALDELLSVTARTPIDIAELLFANEKARKAIKKVTS